MSRSTDEAMEVLFPLRTWEMIVHATSPRTPPPSWLQIFGICSVDYREDTPKMSLSCLWICADDKEMQSVRKVADRLAENGRNQPISAAATSQT